MDKHSLGAVSLLAAAASMGGGLPDMRGMVYPDTTKGKLSKCGLPSCDVQTEKAYCCAEHCKEHKRRK